MNFHASLYYKNIHDICEAYNQRINEIDMTDIEQSEKQYNAAADKVLYFFCQATEMYCRTIHHFNASTLPDEVKHEMRDALDELRDRCVTLLEMMEKLHEIDNKKMDPTNEFIQFGNYLYRYNRDGNSLKRMLESQELFHQKTMTEVRTLKNAVINGFLVSDYRMIDVGDSAHKLARSKALIQHCLAPASLISEEQDCAKVGRSVYKRVLARESQRQVKTALTQQGFICTLYSRTLTLNDQKKVIAGQSVESVLAKKPKPESTEKYEHVFSLITTDHTGLVYTQRNNKMGLQFGKWFKRDGEGVGHLLTFRSQNDWDGTKEIKNRDFVNAMKSSIDMWRNLRDGLKEIKDRLTINPMRRNLEKKIDSIFSQETAEKVADLIAQPRSILLTLRTENNFAVTQSSADMEFLSSIRRDDYMRTFKRCLKKNAQAKAITSDKSLAQWENTTRYASDAISAATDTFEYIAEAVKNKSVGLDSTLDMTSMIMDNVIPFEDFSAASIQEAVRRITGYADKLLNLAEIDEKFADKNDPQCKEQMQQIRESFDAQELAKFQDDVEVAIVSQKEAQEEHSEELIR